MPAVTPLPAAEPSATPLSALSSAPDAFVRSTRIVAVASLLAMIVLGLAWELWLALPLAGLLKHRLYTYRWVSLLVWLYFAEGIVRATSSQGAVVWLAWGQVLLCVLLFGACAAHVRWRLGEAKAKASSFAKEPAP
jgi:uncharacterized membrane protein